ncbi:hypothetical protein [Parafrankia sp. BMG5.11]|uniref:hypothetical protein n=1 Tax=Parafrankia sp. BMG5.11 TaxID=222540 RepID=UPI00103C116F|nr:hypothetical protein [Parafrankia sp. BMG5.11]TCJ36913.1 hypothetical protein E0504_21810 [Parafrankia sp. BMG5.11]
MTTASSAGARGGAGRRSGRGRPASAGAATTGTTTGTTTAAAAAVTTVTAALLAAAFWAWAAHRVPAVDVAADATVVLGLRVIVSLARAAAPGPGARHRLRAGALAALGAVTLAWAGGSLIPSLAFLAATPGFLILLPLAAASVALWPARPDVWRFNASQDSPNRRTSAAGMLVAAGAWVALGAVRVGALVFAADVAARGGAGHAHVALLAWLAPVALAAGPRCGWLLWRTDADPGLASSRVATPAGRQRPVRRLGAPRRTTTTARAVPAPEWEPPAPGSRPGLRSLPARGSQPAPGSLPTRGSPPTPDSLPAVGSPSERGSVVRPSAQRWAQGPQRPPRSRRPSLPPTRSPQAPTPRSPFSALPTAPPSRTPFGRTQVDEAARRSLASLAAAPAAPAAPEPVTRVLWSAAAAGLALVVLDHQVGPGSAAFALAVLAILAVGGFAGGRGAATLPCVAVALVAAPLPLAVLGDEYADQGTAGLRLLLATLAIDALPTGARPTGAQPSSGVRAAARPVIRRGATVTGLAVLVAALPIMLAAWGAEGAALALLLGRVVAVAPVVRLPARRERAGGPAAEAPGQSRPAGTAPAAVDRRPEAAGRGGRRARMARFAPGVSHPSRSL